MKATSTTSENERRLEVMRSFCSFYANDVLWVLIFEEQFSYHQTTRRPRKNKKMAISLSFHKEPFLAQYLKKRFYSSNIFVSGGDPICFVCFWKFELQSQNRRFFIILTD